MKRSALLSAAGGMSVIEGVGDEVTVGVGLLALLLVVLLAWVSTHTPHIPFVSVIVVELSQRRNRNRANAQRPAGTPTLQPDGGGESGAVSDVTASDAGAGSNNNAETSGDESASADNSKTKLEKAVPSQSDATAAPESHAGPGATKPPDRATTSPGTEEQTGQSGSTESRVVKSAQPAETVPASSEVPAASQFLPSPFDEGAASDIPQFKGADQSSDEVRRRRVAYFDSTRDGGKSDRVSIGAELEEFSLGAQNQWETSSSNVEDSPPPPFPPEDWSEGGPGEERSRSVVDGNDPPPARGVSVSPAEGSPADSPSGEDSPPGIGGGGPGVEGSPSPAVGGSSPPSVGAAPAGVGGSVEGGPVAVRADSGAESVEEGAEQIRVRLKYLNDTQRLVYADPTQTVGNFRR